MLTLIYYQFRYTKKQWLGTIPVFLISSILVGTCLTIANNISANPILFQDVGTPIPIFVGPIIFGGLTLLFLISSSIQLLLNYFKEDYQTWNKLGTNRNQLAFLVAGQITIISFLVSIVGSFISIFVARYYYSLVQHLAGKAQLPSIPIVFDFKAFCLTILLIPILAFCGSFIHTRKILNQVIESQENDNLKRRKLSRVAKLGGTTILFFLWGWLAYEFFYPPTSLSGDDLIFKLDDNILVILILHIIMIHFLSPELPEFIVKLLFRKTHSYSSTLAKWQVLENRSYLKSLSSSVMMGIVLISGFLMYSTVSYGDLANQSQQANETNAVLLLFVAGPILVILANIITITILSSFAEKRVVQQWNVLGISKSQRYFVRLSEAGIYSLLIVIISSIFNSIYYVLSLQLAKAVSVKVTSSANAYLCTLLISILMFLFLVITKVSIDSNVDRNTKEV
ncbi:FtsX-like permease family protein [Streptococcus salivarius]|uniref:FtsX-like permease family protein n=1 Tax=Streptococcus salivarius TaxID=1304 RepID=UPI00093C532E|nr:FtsX-like permease family protein [Streptococcus salivarius]